MRPPRLRYLQKAAHAASFLLVIATAPAVSEELTIDAFLQEAEVWDAALSPDGKHLAMIINEPSRRLVVVRNVEEPDMPIVGAFAEHTVLPEWLSWGNNDRLLISMSIPWSEYLKAKTMRSVYFESGDGPEFSRMISVNADMSDMAVLMEDDKNLRRNFSLSRITNYLPKHTDNVLMAAYRAGERFLYKVNVNTGATEFLAEGSTRTRGFLTNEDGEPLYRFDYRRRSKTYEIFKYEGDEDWKLVDRIGLSDDDEDAISNRDLVALFGDDVVYRKPNEETGFYELTLVDRKTHERKVLASLEDQDVFAALYHDRSDQLIGYQVEKDYVRNVYFDKDVQARYDAIAARLENYNFRVSSLAPESERALVQVWGADTPTTYFLWDFGKQALTFLAHAYPSLRPENLSTPAATSYVARDGAVLRAYILLPKNFEQGKPHPTVFLPHGGPHARSRQQYDDFAQFLSTRGYIVVMPNFRGSTGYGQAFEAAGYRQWGGLMQDDLTDAANFMVEKGYADPERMCIVGASYGGYAALMAAIKTPDLFKCAVSLNGVTHLADQVRHDMKEYVDKGHWQELLFDRIGDPDADRAMLDANSPALNADKIHIPVLLVAGTDDDIVPYSQARQMVSAMKKAGVEYQFLKVPDATHNIFYYREDMLTIYDTVERFLALNLY